jgi:hypothetical protein
MTGRNYGEHGRCQATAKSTGEQCKKSAIGPHGKCDSHGGKSKKGADHPNFTHGKTSKYFKSKLSERQRDVYDEMAKAFDDDADAKLILAQVATQMIVRGESMGDPAMVREGRQLLSEFGVVEAAPEKHEVDATVDQKTEVGLDEETEEILDDLTGGL